jgi:valine--pyruvate aminotransferase
MEFTRFGSKFTSHTGILALMDDMGKALDPAAAASGEPPLMLGGGNPAQIPEVAAIWRERMAELLARGDEFDRMLGNYDTPQGKTEFLDALAELLHREYGWPIDARNIAITNGSQSGFFFLFNLFAGRYRDGSTRRVLFPVVPEYIGYADQSVHLEDFVARRPRIEELGGRRFKYRVDFDRLRLDDSIAALCVSRPTNPSGNVLTDQELRRLAEAAAARDIPLLVDNAYGLPFPGIVFMDAAPYWDPNVVLCMSLSKIGLPAARTGIIVAQARIIEAISAMNAIASLANGSLGQVLTLPLVRSGGIIRLGHEVVRPFYQSKSVQAQAWIDEALAPSGTDWSIHVSEGAIFLWIWFKNLPVSTTVLYERLKARKVVVVPGQYFFFGDDATVDGPGEIGGWRHREECLRLSYAGEPEVVRRGIGILGEEVAVLMRQA